MEWEQQRPSAPSTPSSMSSQSTGNNGSRPEKIPTLKQISPSPSVSALSKLSDEELRRKGTDDLMRILRKIEADYKSLLGEHGNIVKDVNRRFQIFVLEIRSLKEVNQKLQDDNQELRDLCCFLDDDRQRGRKLAREWQRFGRYTASVMRSEVAVYQEKLRELEDRQSELVTENMELKELCLYLDQERVRMTGDRDEGDGSSNGTVTGLEDGIVSMETNGSATPTPTSTAAISNSYPITPSSAASYIRELELKVHRLEEEKRQLAQRVDRNNAEGHDVLTSGAGAASGDQSVHGSVSGAAVMRKSPVSSKPEAVVHAMKVLQVHEELEKTPTEDEDLDDPEKAIVREMCNVVWRKLGDVGDVGSFNDSSDSIVDPPFMQDSPVKSPGTMSSGQAHSYSVAQPQPQMASTPLSGGGKPPHLGNEFPPAAADQVPATAYPYHQQRQERHHPLRPSEESNLPLSSHPSYPHSHDPGMRNRQNSMSERQTGDRSEDKRSADSKPFSHQFNDTGRSGGGQPQAPHHFSRQPPLPSSLQQQTQNLPPDARAYPHSSQRPPADMTARGPGQPTHVQQPPPPPQNPPPSMQRHPNQRPVDPPPQLNHPHNARMQGEAPNPANATGVYSQIQPPQQRTAQHYPQQTGRSLDASGVYNYSGADPAGHHYQRSAPSQPNAPKRDLYRDESTFHGQGRPRSRGESLYEERGSAERETQPPPSLRTASSSALHQPATQVPSQNLPATISQQNLRGPSGFRAYPPQLNSMPTQPVAWRGARGQDPANSSSMHPQDHHAPRPNQYTNDPSPRPGYASGPPAQKKGNPGNKRYQEQEWRQTYLDDGETL